MPSYLYRAARADGTTLEGQAEGEDEQAVRAELEKKGFLVFRLRPLGAWPVFMGSGLWGRKRGIPLQEFLVFNQELLALVKAGLPILRIFDLLIERARRPAFQAVLRAVRQDIRGGTAMSDALARHPLFFPELYIASLKAGEQAGNLPEVLQRYIAYLKLIMGLRQKMTKALAYPAFLVIVGAAVVGFLLTYVLPTFSVIYGEAGTNVPEATRALIAVVEAIQSHLVSIGLAIVALFAAFRWWVRTDTGRALWDRTTLKVPLIGDVLVKHQTIQFARTLATVLAGGTPLVSALQTVRGALTNRFLAAGLATATERVREGTTLSAALEGVKVFPRMALEMLAVGEETGSLDAMLRDVAELYEGDLDQRLSQLTTWIEPVLLLVMGLVVGAIVVIMYLPVFEMAGTVR
jgi:type IV pilus assembly protein PilC